MNKDKLFQRTLKNNCPICNKPLEGETEVVIYDESKLEVHKNHIKFNIGDKNEKERSK